MVTTRTLKLVRETKIGDRVPRNRTPKRWEASGVLAKDAHFLVVFDDRTEIARLSDGLRHARTIALPPSVPFVDYSGMSLENGRVTIASQVNSMLWVGEFDKATWTWRNRGRLYEFARSDDGAIRYGNIEGVIWIRTDAHCHRIGQAQEEGSAR